MFFKCSYLFFFFTDIITNGNHIGDPNADMNRLGANLNRNTLIIHSVQRVSILKKNIFKFETFS